MLKLKKLIFKLFRTLFHPNEMENLLLRRLFHNIYDIEVGMYSYGCFDQTRFQGGLKVGRYCSFSRTCRRVNANHGLHYLTLHPFAYNTSLGVVKNEMVTRTKCVIEDDVWIGHNVVILPSVKHIGRGAVIAAGAVVTKDVEAYSIVAGVPASKIASRFSDDEIYLIEKSKWWLLDKDEFHKLISTSPEVIYKPTSYLKGNIFK